MFERRKYEVLEKETEAADHSQTKDKYRFTETSAKMGAKIKIHSAAQTKAG
ncbi:hypothetical protein [Parabacteroides goldsteinii]|uniref:hypothetical protein n=1 Tax=Parabacteroides goldsteinii TaxID=328812 RepID=UPI0026028953|nr:hypothetical protein [Parabacteroides goldsteinii]